MPGQVSTSHAICIAHTGKFAGMHVDVSSLSQLRTRNFETQVVTKPRRARHSSKYGIRSHPSVVVAPSTTEKNCKTLSTYDFQKIRPLFSTSSASLQLFARKQTNFLQIQNAENGVFVSLWRAARKVPRSGTGSAFKTLKTIHNARSQS